jgi:hypothetical protein
MGDKYKEQLWFLWDFRFYSLCESSNFYLRAKSEESKLYIFPSGLLNKYSSTAKKTQLSWCDGEEEHLSDLCQQGCCAVPG